ncbi:MAG: AAA family ATPase [Candidatus Thiodiazotropha sp.]
MDVTQVQRAPAETKFSEELTRLQENDREAKPNGWSLSPRSVRSFILGDKTLDVSQKFFGDDPLVDRCIVSLMGHQGLMLVGEPGTAKSLLSELLAAAISGDSNLVIQGSAGILEDHLRYGWNYALLLAEGPGEKALVPSPVLSAMQTGKIARLEELTRCAPEVQDAMISLLSEKTISIPELGPGKEVRAVPGFNVIGTANLRDRGVHDMSSALKRRFNFETVKPIADANFEKELVARQVAERMNNHATIAPIDTNVIDVLVSVFRDLRTGKTVDGASVASPNSVMSTAEAVNVAHAAALDALYLDGSKVSTSHVARQIRGVVFKDDLEDARRFRAYVDQIAKVRMKKSKAWSEFYKTAKKDLDG